jgi:MFS family permease
VFTAGSGVSVSLTFPLLFAWVEEDFFHVTAGVAVALTISCGVGLIISPIIVGLIMEISTVYYSVFLFANSLMLFLHLCIGKIVSLKVQSFRRRDDVLK